MNIYDLFNIDREEFHIQAQKTVAKYKTQNPGVDVDKYIATAKELYKAETQWNDELEGK